MKKNLLLLLVSLLFIGFNSCSDDDNEVIESRIEFDALDGGFVVKEGESITINPKIETDENNQFSWAVDGVVVSDQSALVFEGSKVGENKVTVVITNLTKNTRRIGAVSVDVKPYDVDYVTLDLSTFDLSNGRETAGGKYWVDTYSEDAILKSQIFTFSHTGMEDWNYWQGFTVSNSTVNTDFGEGESGGWIPNQFCSMPKGGVDGVGSPFVVAYGMGGAQPKEDALFEEKKYSNWIKIGDQEAYRAISIKATNNPWPYYGILNGDSFARKFEKGDYFVLKVYGVKADMKITKPVEFYLADYRSAKAEEWTLSTSWDAIDLTSLGEIKYVFFLLESTDTGNWGMNTASYYCLDKLTVEKAD